MSLREYAKDKGVGESTIRKARGKRLSEKCFGKNEKNGRPFIYKELADLDWVNNFNPSHKRVIKDKTDGTVKTNHDAINKGTGIGSQLEGLSRNKTLKEGIEVQMQAIRLAEMQGKFVQKDKVYNTLFGFAAEIRQTLQDIPDQETDNIMAEAAKGNRDGVYNLLAAAIDRALFSLTNVTEAVQL